MKARLTAGVGALLVVIVGGAATYSLWTESGLLATNEMLSGDLDITLTGDPAWHETSASEADQTINPSGFRAMPGDTFTITQGVITTLRGDNIAGELTVRWADPPAAERLPDGVRATYTVQDGGGVAVTEDTPLGVSVTVPALPPGERTWTVSITLTFDDAATPRYVDPAVGDATDTSVSLDEVILELDQVRPAGSGAP